MKWIKIWTEETVRGTTFTELSISERGIWFSLLAMAGDSPNEGRIFLRQDVGYDLETLSKIINCNKIELESSLTKLLEVGKITITENKVISISNWEKYQDDYHRYQKRQYLKEVSKKTLRKNKVVADIDIDIDKDKELIVPNELLENKSDIIRWLDYKKEKGQTYKARGLEALWKRLIDIPYSRRKEAIEFSMASNYSGIFEKNIKESKYIPINEGIKKDENRCGCGGKPEKAVDGKIRCTNCNQEFANQKIELTLNKI